MKKRTRTVRLQFYVSEVEKELIEQKMLQTGTRNFSLFARKLILDGYIIRRDFRELKLLTRELANLARSINQIALRVNETRNIYAQDIEDLQRMYNEVKSKVSERLVKLIKE